MIKQSITLTHPEEDFGKVVIRLDYLAKAIITRVEKTKEYPAFTRIDIGENGKCGYVVKETVNRVHNLYLIAIVNNIEHFEKEYKKYCEINGIISWKNEDFSWNNPAE